MINEKMAIPGHPGYYADRKGRIWSNRNGHWHLLKSTVNGTGYQYTHMKEKETGYWKQHLTQRLVCAAIKGETSDTLPLCIRKAPSQQPRRIRKQRYLHWGDRSEVQRKSFVRLTNDEKWNILRLLSEGYSQVEIAESYGVSQPAISYIVHGKTRVQ